LLLREDAAVVVADAKWKRLMPVVQSGSGVDRGGLLRVEVSGDSLSSPT
jgi:hypothetical protein